MSRPTKAASACPVRCCARLVRPAARNRNNAGDVWHAQRDRAVLALPYGRLMGKRCFLPPHVPTPPERVSRGRAQQPMRKERTRHGLSYPKRIGRRLFFLVSQAIAAATWAEEFAVSYPQNDRTASISTGAGVIPRWCYKILYCSGWGGPDAVGAGRAAGRGALYGVPGVQRGDV